MASGDHRRAGIQPVSAGPQLTLSHEISHECRPHRLGRIDVFELDAPSAEAGEVHPKEIHLYVSSVVSCSDHRSVSRRRSGRRRPDPHHARKIFRRILGDGESEEGVIMYQV